MGSHFYSNIGPAPVHSPLAGGNYHQPWKSPVPYLFGGVAAMLGLISLALLILCCSFHGMSAANNDVSYRRKSMDPEVGSVGLSPKVVVIMAGEQAPTHLAKATGKKPS